MKSLPNYKINGHYKINGQGQQIFNMFNKLRLIIITDLTKSKINDLFIIHLVIIHFIYLFLYLFIY